MGENSCKHKCDDGELKPAYLLTPWRTVPLEKLTGSKLVKKFLAFYGI